jgi:hypothetical protein
MKTSSEITWPCGELSVPCTVTLWTSAHELSGFTARRLCVSLYYTHYRCMSSTTMIGTIFGSFDKDFLEISDNIRHHWTEIDIAANFVNIAESRMIREAEEARRRGNLHLPMHSRADLT